MRGVLCMAWMVLGSASPWAMAQDAEIGRAVPVGSIRLNGAAPLASDEGPSWRGERTNEPPSATNPADYGFLDSARLSLSPDVPDDARALLGRFHDEADEIRKAAHQAIAKKRDALVISLQEIQDRHTRAARLDEAVAVRDTIRKLQETDARVLTAPANLVRFREWIGKTLTFRVTGRTGGVIYGTNAYTYDSDLATACVHAGVLAVGETGLVQATIIHNEEVHAASLQHGVQSSPWGIYPASYTLRRWKQPEEKQPSPNVPAKD